MKKRVLDHFNVNRDTVYRSDLFRRHAGDITDHVHMNDMLAIVGGPGMGKTTLYHEAARRLSQHDDQAPLIVRVRNEDKESMRIGSIITAMLLELLDGTSERIRSDMEARTRQLITHLGKRCVHNGKIVRRVVLLIENAHRLHANTLMAIKGLHENDFAGVHPLFSVVLIGQEQLAEKIGRYKEVRWRFESIELSADAGWMDHADRMKFLKAVYGESLNARARERVATMCDGPLHMHYFLDRYMEEAYAAGLKTLSEDAFPMTPQEHARMIEASLGEIANESGLAKTTVHNVMRGSDVRNKSQVLEALKRIEEKRTEGKGKTIDFKRAAAGER